MKTITASLPYTVTVPIYAQAVALAQALGDPAVDLESVTDTVIHYMSE